MFSAFSKRLPPLILLINSTFDTKSLTGNINGHHYSCTGGWGDTIMCPPKQEMIRAFKAGVEFNRNENNNENN